MRIVRFIETTDIEAVNPVKTFQAHIQVNELIIFDLDFQLRIRDRVTSDEVYSQHSRQQSVNIAWLPRGSYVLNVELSDPVIPAGNYTFDLLTWSNANGRPVFHDEANIDGELGEPDDDPCSGQTKCELIPATKILTLVSCPGTSNTVTGFSDISIMPRE